MTGRLQKIIFNTLSVGLAIAVFYFLGVKLHSQWGLISHYKFHFRWDLLLLASATYVIMMLVLALGWWMILRNMRTQITLRDALIYFFITLPCKYVPGKIWVAVARSRLCKKYGTSTSVAFISTGLEGLLETLAGIYISIFAVVTSPFFGHGVKIGALVFVLLGLLLLIPKIFYSVVNFTLRLTRQPEIPAEARVGFKKLIQLQFVYGAGMLLMGVAQVLFLKSLTHVPHQYIPFLISMGTFSYVASILAVLPGGLGVREGIWYLVLKDIVVDFVGLIFALVSRLWTITIEALTAFIALGFFFLLRNHGEKESVQRKVTK